MVVDIYRLENGRISEHWDVIQKINENNDNPEAFYTGFIE